MQGNWRSATESDIDSTVVSERELISCSWDLAANLLCESSVIRVQEFSAFQVFEVVHPVVGRLEIVLSAVSTSVLRILSAESDEMVARLSTWLPSMKINHILKEISLSTDCQPPVTVTA